MRRVVIHSAVGMTCLALASVCHAITVQTEGAGSAVTSADRTATFSDLVSGNAVNLDSYTNAAKNLSITTASTSWGEDPGFVALDPFHAPGPAPLAFYAMANGSDEWVTIQTTDSKPIFGAEFRYGNTWTTGDIFGKYPWGNANALFEWETFKNGNMVSSGSVPFLPLATILGFLDPDGFDQLLVRSTISTAANSPPNQAIALDGLSVQLSPPSEIPLPAALPLFATGLGVMGLLGWRRRRKNTARAA